jgi:hypothetical protein
MGNIVDPRLISVSCSGDYADIRARINSFHRLAAHTLEGLVGSAWRALHHAQTTY